MAYFSLYIMDGICKVGRVEHSRRTTTKMPFTLLTRKS